MGLYPIIISVVVAYLLSGISQVITDLNRSVVNQPRWAWSPTLGKAILVAARWPLRPILSNIWSNVQMARAIAFGLLGVILQMSVLSGFIWCCIAVSALIFHNVALQIGLALMLVVIGAPIVLPLLNFLTMPLTLIIAWPLDLLFPIKEGINAREIKWCRNCRHYRKLKEYENIVNGLWRSVSMPRSDQLPCGIVLETVAVWKHYFESEPNSRTLFPQDCQFFEKKI